MNILAPVKSCPGVHAKLNELLAKCHIWCVGWMNIAALETHLCEVYAF